MTDAELVERAQRGDSDAFGVLVERHHRAALRAAVAALGTTGEADDAVQDAWIAARGRLADFRGDAAFRTWLLAIVWHKATDRRRRVAGWLRRMVSLDAGGGQSGEFAIRIGLLPAGAASPERATIDEERRRTVARLVRALPPKLRDPLLLIGAGDYSYDDVAAMLATPAGTVKWRVSEARRQLRVKLTRLGF